MPGDLPADEETTDGPRPFGVPKDYSVTLPNQAGQTADALSRTTTQAPRYWTGDEWTIARGIEASDRAALQLLMKEMGFISPTSRLVLGAWDQTSANGFKEILSWANVNGTNWQSALVSMRENAMQFTDPGEAGAPLVARVSNPDEIAAGLRDVFRERLGAGDIPEEKIKAMVAAYQGEEAAAQRQEHELAQTGGGTVVAPPDFQTWAAEQARRTDPTAYDANKVVDRFSRMADLLGGQG